MARVNQEEDMSEDAYIRNEKMRGAKRAIARGEISDVEVPETIESYLPGIFEQLGKQEEVIDHALHRFAPVLHPDHGELAANPGESVNADYSPVLITLIEVRRRINHNTRAIQELINRANV